MVNRFVLFVLMTFVCLPANLIFGQSKSTTSEYELAIQSDDEKLAGTLICPAGDGPFACVLLTHGSDPAIRSRYRHLADPFVARGIAAFIYDKRGCGKSSGNYVEAPDLDFPTADLLACVKQVKSNKLIDPKRIGVWGISQGGWVGPLAASKTESISFVIMISGPTISPLEQNLFDKGNQLKRHGLTDEEIGQITKVRKLVWYYLAKGINQEAANLAWQDAKKQTWFKQLRNEPPMGDRIQILKHPRMIHFAPHSNYEPAETLKSLNVPVLAVYGGADTIVPAKRCVTTLEQYFDGPRSELLTTKIFPGANHGIQIAENGIRKFAPGYWELVLDWTEKQTKHIN